MTKTSSTRSRQVFQVLVEGIALGLAAAQEGTVEVGREDQPVGPADRFWRGEGGGRLVGHGGSVAVAVRGGEGSGEPRSRSRCLGFDDDMRHLRRAPRASGRPVSASTAASDGDAPVDHGVHGLRDRHGDAVATGKAHDLGGIGGAFDGARPFARASSIGVPSPSATPESHVAALCRAAGQRQVAEGRRDRSASPAGRPAPCRAG